MTREFLREFVTERQGRPMLEIGPFMNPFLPKGWNEVYYADIRSKDEIYQHYLPHHLCAPEVLYARIFPIDFVVKDTYEKAVGGKRFAVVFSSHVIEHVDDIIRHLLDLGKILDDGGCLAMAVPDKRYTFDHFREVTPFRDMIDVYMEGTVKSTARLMFDMTFTCHPCNNPNDYEAGRVFFTEVAGETDRFQKAIELYKRVKEEGYVVSEHNWVFTYASFLDFIRDGLRAGLLPFTLLYSHPPVATANEFTVILKKDESILQDSEKRMAEIMKLVKLAESA